MNKSIFLVSSTLLSMALFSCGSSVDEEVIEAPEVVEAPVKKQISLTEEYGEPIVATWEQIQTKGKEDLYDKFISVSGFVSELRFDSIVRGQDVSYKMHVSLRNYPEDHRYKVDFDFRINNSTKIPDFVKWIDGEYWFVTEGENQVRFGNYITINGLMAAKYDPSRHHVGSIGFSRIESITTDRPSDIQAFIDSAEKFSSSMLKDTTTNRFLGYLEGRPSLPKSFTDGKRIVLRGNSVKEIKSVKLKTYTENRPNTMEPIPPGYTDNDLVIRDWNGNNIDNSKNTKVYGSITRLKVPTPRNQWAEREKPEYEVKWEFNVIAIVQ